MDNTKTPRRPAIAIVGAGPAGMMAAEVAASGGAAVTVFERMPSVGRKFLLAGRDGLNITHGEPADLFLTRYGKSEEQLRPLIEAWTPADLRAWCEGLGQPTFVGTSGRVFPAAFKASPLLRAWLRRLDGLGVVVKTRHRWTGWDADGRLHMETPNGGLSLDADSVVLALGGASWPRLGSDGAWGDALRGMGVAVAPLQPANCGFAVPWSGHFKDRFEGQPLKGIALRFGAARIRGEALVTRTGIEGGAVYALSSLLREALAEGVPVTLHLALRPDLSDAALVARLGIRQPKQSFATAMRKALNLPPVAIALLREAERTMARPVASLEPQALACLINAVPISITAPMPIAKAISSAGGVVFDSLDANLMLRQRPGTFIAGEMLDWEAPTGGYLLQACFATGAAAGRSALTWGGRGSSTAIRVKTGLKKGRRLAGGGAVS